MMVTASLTSSAFSWRSVVTALSRLGGGKDERDESTVKSGRISRQALYRVNPARFLFVVAAGVIVGESLVGVGNAILALDWALFWAN